MSLIDNRIKKWLILYRDDAFNSSFTGGTDYEKHICPAFSIEEGSREWDYTGPIPVNEHLI